MTHTYIIRIGRLLFQWQKLLTSACRRCRVSAVAESVSDTDRSTGFAQKMLAHFPASNAVLAAVFNRTDYCIRMLNTLALLWCLQISWDVHRFKVKHDSATLPADSDYIETDRADRMAMPRHKKYAANSQKQLIG